MLGYREVEGLVDDVLRLACTLWNNACLVNELVQAGHVFRRAC